MKQNKNHKATLSSSQQPLQAEYEVKMQVIRSKGRAVRLFVNIPMPLAGAMDIQAGERVRWQLLGRDELRLVRLEAPPADKALNK